jgi:transposase
MLDDPNLYASEAGKLVGFRSPIIGVMWVRRFNEEGLAGLPDKKRGGRKPTHSQAVAASITNASWRFVRPDSPGRSGQSKR